MTKKVIASVAVELQKQIADLTKQLEWCKARCERLRGERDDNADLLDGMRQIVMGMVEVCDTRDALLRRAIATSVIGHELREEITKAIGEK